MTTSPSRALVFARLVRLPNVFTALADIALGIAVAGIDHFDVRLVALFAASGCLYSAGMVWNDFFDIEQDARERPQRPLPSGQVSTRSAGILAVSLTLVGLFCAFLAGRISALIAGGLVAAILIYDGWLKRTNFGPIGMGACRFLNVLLGMSTFDSVTVDWNLRLHLASVVGIYVAGITWFARREAATSRATHLRAAAALTAASLALAIAIPLHVPSGTASPAFPYFLVALGVVIAVPIVRAIRRPEPATMQAAVKTAILSIIGLDAVLATAISGWSGLIILLLLPPALILGRRIYST